jgi:hypothetical protein
MDGNLYTLELLQELQDQGRLPIRVKVAFHFKPWMELGMLEKASAMMRDWRGDWLRRASSRCSWTAWWTAAPPS